MICHCMDNEPRASQTLCNTQGNSAVSGISLAHMNIPQIRAGIGLVCKSLEFLD